MSEPRPSLVPEESNYPEELLHDFPLSPQTELSSEGADLLLTASWREILATRGIIGLLVAAYLRHLHEPDEKTKREGKVKLEDNEADFLSLLKQAVKEEVRTLWGKLPNPTGIVDPIYFRYLVTLNKFFCNDPSAPEVDATVLADQYSRKHYTSFLYILNKYKIYGGPLLEEEIAKVGSAHPNLLDVEPPVDVEEMYTLLYATYLELVDELNTHFLVYLDTNQDKKLLLGK